MLQFFKNIFDLDEPESMEDKYSDNMIIKIATCALFLELANSDDKIVASEMDAIYQIMREKFSLSDKEIENLIKLSEEQIKYSVSLYEFTDIINRKFSYDQKYEIVKNLWRIILADNILDPYEELIIKKISGNLKFYHKELIAAKLEVKKELEM